MKIISDIHDGHAIVTYAEVAAFLGEKQIEKKVPLEGGSVFDCGEAANLTRLVKRHIRSSPAGLQTVESVARLRLALEPFQLSEVEFAQIANLRADTDATLEMVLAADTAARLSDVEWNAMRSIINEVLEPRPEDDSGATMNGGGSRGKASDRRNMQ
jgi:hypothetical protein